MSDCCDPVPTTDSDDSFDRLLDSVSSDEVEKTSDDLVVIDSHSDLLEKFEQLKLAHAELKMDNEKKIWKIGEMSRICKVRRRIQEEMKHASFRKPQLNCLKSSTCKPWSLRM